MPSLGRCRELFALASATPAVLLTIQPTTVSGIIRRRFKSIITPILLPTRNSSMCSGAATLRVQDPFPGSTDRSSSFITNSSSALPWIQRSGKKSIKRCSQRLYHFRSSSSLKTTIRSTTCVRWRNPLEEDFTNSTVTARLNGYIGGFGTENQLERELDSFALSDRAEKYIRERVSRR